MWFPPPPVTINYLLEHKKNHSEQCAIEQEFNLLEPARHFLSVKGGQWVPPQIAVLGGQLKMLGGSKLSSYDGGSYFWVDAPSRPKGDAFWSIFWSSMVKDGQDWLFALLYCLQFWGSW